MSDADDPTRPGPFARLVTAARADHGILATLRGRIPTVIGMILLPLLIASSLLWGTGGNTGRLHRAEAAIVNLDQGTVVDEKPISLGQDYARHLKDQQSSNFTWRYGVSVEEAERGLASGQYSAAVIIPSGFSRVLTGTTAKGSTEKATLVVEKSPVAGVSDQVVFGQLSTAATQSLSSSVTKKHLDDLFVTSTQVGSVLGQTSTAAQEAALAAGQLDKQAKSAQQASKDLDKQVTAASGTAQQASDAAAKTASGVSKAGTTGSPAAAGASVDPDAAKAQAAQAAKQAAELAKTSAAAKTSADQATRRAASAGGDGVALQGITGTIAEAAAANKEAAGAYTGKVGQAVRQQAELQSQLAQLQGALTSYVSNVQVVTNAVQQASGVAAGPAGTSQPVVGAQDSSGGNGPNRPRSAMLGPVRAQNLPQAPNDDATTERDAVAKALREAARTLAASTTELSAARQDAKKTVAAAKAVQASHDALIKNLPTKQIELSRGLGSAPAACAGLDKSQIRACKAGYEAGYNDAVQEVRAALALSRLGSRTDAMLTQSQATLDGLEALQSTGAETAATLTLLAGRVADLTVVITITPETPTASPSPPQSCPEPTPTVTVTATPEPTAAPTATVTVTAPPEPGATPTAAPTATVTVTAPPEPGATTTPAPPNCTLPSTLPSEPQPGTPSPTDSLPAPTNAESPAPTGTESPEPPSPSDEASQTPVDSQSPSPSESSSPVDTSEPSPSSAASQTPAPTDSESSAPSTESPVPPGTETPAPTGTESPEPPSPSDEPSQAPVDSQSPSPSESSSPVDTSEPSQSPVAQAPAPSQGQSPTSSAGPVPSENPGENPSQQPSPGAGPSQGPSQPSAGVAQLRTREVATAVSELNATSATVQKQLATLGKSLQSGQDSLETVAAGSDAQRALTDGASSISQATTAQASVVSQLTSSLTALNQQMAGLSKSVQGLESGAQNLSQENSRISDNATRTAARLDALNQTVAGLQQNTAQVASDASTTAQRTAELQRQITALQQSSGIVETRVGVVADSTGAQTKQVGKVANQVSDVQAQVPSYDETQRQKLADVVTQPIETSQSSAFRNVGWISMLMLLSLWIGAMGLHSTLNGISDQARRSTAPSRRLLLGELGPAAVVAVLQALAVSMVGQAVLQMSPLRWAGVTGTLVLASLGFAAINHALVAYLRAFGRLIAATCAAVTGVTVLTQTYPTGMGLALNLSPVTPAVNAVRGLMTGVSTPGSFAGLLVWLAAGVLFSSLAILRARDPEPIRVPTIHDEV